MIFIKIAIVTGAAGFIGFKLTKKLLEEDMEVYAIDLIDNENKFPVHHRLHFLSSDFMFTDLLSGKLQNVKIDVFYHLAWVGVSSNAKNDLALQTKNINLCLDAIKLCGLLQCKKIIIPGSASEFAYCGQTITGNNIPAPGDAYAASKAATHVLCQWYAKQIGVSLNWLLIGSTYGPGRDDNNIITYTIKALLHNKKTEYTKLEQIWDYIYIDDLIQAFYLIGVKGKLGKCYPVGSGIARPLHDYIRIIHQQIAYEQALGIGLLPYKLGEKPDNSVLDISELVNDTGFSPIVTFKYGIKNTIEYFKQELENI